MVRNFVTGVLMGGVVAAGGLAGVSLMVPLHGPQKGEALSEGVPAAADAGAETAAADTTTAAPATEAPAEAAADATAEAAAPEVTETGAADLAADGTGSDAAPSDTAMAAPEPDAPAEPDEPLLSPLVAAPATPPASVVPQTLPAQPETDEQAARTAEPEGDAAPQTTDTAAAAQPKAAQPEIAQPETAQPETAQPAPETSDAAVAAAEPAPEMEAPAPTEVVPAPAENAPAEEAPADITPAPGAAQTPAADSAEEPATQRMPSTGLAEKTVDGVITGRLPSIAAAPAGLADAGAVPAALPTDLPTDLPPVQRYAQPFENPQAKPLFAVLLVDPGTPGLDRAELAALPFPVTFVLDPMAEGADAAAAIYRAAGQEVVMAASAIPPGAKASDLEQSFAGIEGRLPEAVALIETPEPRFQDDRALASDVVTLLADQGRGLVTYDRGLNAADQVARRENLPAATIFRSLDDEGEDSPLIRRYLDRAAFKAAQEGRVAVIGTARPQTIAALLEWSVEGRASSVALAPITALMATK